MKNYDAESIISQECQHTTCVYWRQGGCILPWRCRYATDDCRDRTVARKEKL